MCLWGKQRFLRWDIKEGQTIREKNGKSDFRKH